MVVHTAVGAPARLVLDVSGGGRRKTVVARVGGETGFNSLSWNRRFGSTPAPRGRYRLTVTATIGGHSASSQVTVNL